MITPTEVLVAGVGNIFLGDDGFGVEVARRLGEQELPEGVEVADFGIRGVHLAYRLMDGFDMLVLVDALARGDEPGTVYVLEPDVERFRAAACGAATDVPLPDAHSLDPASVLALLATLSVGREMPVRRVLVVGCEPADVSEGIGLSDVVESAVPAAVRAVHDVLADVGSAKTTDGLTGRKA